VAINKEFWVDVMRRLLENNFLYQSNVTPCQVAAYFEALKEYIINTIIGKYKNI
jgi:hypothetical protein